MIPERGGGPGDDTQLPQPHTQLSAWNNFLTETQVARVHVKNEGPTEMTSGGQSLRLIKGWVFAGQSTGETHY